MAVPEVLVTGATGRVGRALIGRLLDAGFAVRALTRDPDAARLPEGVRPVRGDLADPDSFEAAVTGVDAVFLNWPVYTIGTATAATFAARAGEHAARVVYLSSLGVTGDSEGPDPHAVVERAVRESEADWTFLRVGGFATNALGWADAVRAGVVREGFGAAARPLIDERDIADAAFAALTADGHRGAVHRLTGSEALSQERQVEAIAEAVERPVRFEELTPEAARRQVLDRGYPVELVDGIMTTQAALVHTPGEVTDGVEEVTGHPPRSFGQWARDNAGAFR